MNIFGQRNQFHLIVNNVFCFIVAIKRVWIILLAFFVAVVQSRLATHVSRFIFGDPATQSFASSSLDNFMIEFRRFHTFPLFGNSTFSRSEHKNFHDVWLSRHRPNRGCTYFSVSQKPNKVLHSCEKIIDFIAVDENPVILPFGAVQGDTSNGLSNNAAKISLFVKY